MPNVYYATIIEMAESYLRAIFRLAQRFTTHLLNTNNRICRIRWAVSALALAAMILLQSFGAIGPTKKASAAGETYRWASKNAIYVSGGNLERNEQSLYASNNGTYSGTVDTNIGDCSVTLTISNISADHSTGTATGVAHTPCATSVGTGFNGNITIDRTDVWSASTTTIPVGCPGGPAGPTNATIDCPGGGRLVNGTYYNDNNTGVISGKVTLTANCNTASCGCGNATVNVTRISGSYGGDVTTKTGGDGTFVLRLGAGSVTLSTPDCHSDDGKTYSGKSTEITVEALKNTGNHNYVADKLVASGTSDDVCDQASFTELNFWVCAAAKMMSDTAKGLDDAIVGLIKINTDTIFNDSGNSKPGNAFFLAWATFRNIAYIILVIFALIMVASQILGFDFVDAYTFKKLLPKLVIATILIAVSWNGLDFLFNLSNDAADAMQSIIAAPFRGIDVTIGNTTSNNISIALLVPTMLLASGAGVAALAILGVGGIAALIASAVLAVFSAWAILVGRDIIAELLVIMSPIAIILWAFGR